MEYVLTGMEMKQCDTNTIHSYGVPSCVLMERAALASVEVFEEEEFDPEKVLILCGSGNNGGDGLAAARLLSLKGIAAEVCFVGKEESCTEETERQLEICRNYGISLISNPDFFEYTSIVDAIFGIGLSREVTGRYKEMIQAANEAPGRVLALDIPSGIHADTGAVMGIAIKADVTVTFAFFKRGLLLYQGKAHSGKVLVKDIGITKESFQDRSPDAFTYIKEQEHSALLLPERPANANKGTFGKVLLIAGSRYMAGAALLASRGAFCSGAGLVRVFTEECNRQILQTGLPEALVSTYGEGEIREDLAGVSSWPNVAAIGCGLGTKPEKKDLITAAIGMLQIPLVLDADALNIIAEAPYLLTGHKQPVIVTPHVREMSRLMQVSTEEVQKDLGGAARKYAEEQHVVCVLKDAGTVVSDGRRIYINQSGNSGMATGGTGDALTGIIAGLLAQGMDPFQAACSGVWFHGLAGDAAAEQCGPYGMLAGDLIQALGNVMRPAKRR